MRGIALALGGSPYEFEGVRAGDGFWVLRIIGYPGLSGAKDQKKPENNNGWYCNNTEVDVFFLAYDNWEHMLCIISFFLYLFIYLFLWSKLCLCNFSGAHTDYGKEFLNF